MTNGKRSVGVPALAGSGNQDRLKAVHQHGRTSPARFGRCAQLRPGAEAEYDRLHEAVWPGVLEAIRRSGIRNYSIFRQGRWLFSYCELSSEVNFDETVRILLEDPACRHWEAAVQVLQERPEADTGNAAWMPMKEVFHLP